jgi:hypothetical protein
MAVLRNAAKDASSKFLWNAVVYLQVRKPKNPGDKHRSLNRYENLSFTKTREKKQNTIQIIQHYKISTFQTVS